MISYHISLYSYSTPQNTLWESSEYDSISYSLNLNDATTFSVTFPMTSLAPVFATRNDVMVRVHRSVNGNAAPLVDINEMPTPWATPASPLPVRFNRPSWIEFPSK